MSCAFFKNFGIFLDLWVWTQRDKQHQSVMTEPTVALGIYNHTFQWITFSNHVGKATSLALTETPPNPPPLPSPPLRSASAG